MRGRIMLKPCEKALMEEKIKEARRPKLPPKLRSVGIQAGQTCKDMTEDQLQEEFDVNTFCDANTDGMVCSEPTARMAEADREKNPDAPMRLRSKDCGKAKAKAEKDKVKREKAMERAAKKAARPTKFVLLSLKYVQNVKALFQVLLRPRRRRELQHRRP